MPQLHPDPVERQGVTLGVHAHGDRRAGPEGGQEELEGRGAGVVAAHALGLVGGDDVAAGDDDLAVRALPALAGPHAPIVAHAAVP